MIEKLLAPWPWYVAGPLIGLIVPLLLLAGNKPFGISSNLRHICAACIPAKIPFFSYDWKSEAWNLFFVAGIVLGGAITFLFLGGNHSVAISEETVKMLHLYGIRNFDGLMPVQIFSWENIFNLKGLIFFVIGGFLVGFGTRYAGGCTSGHAIMGIANLQWPSLIATISFMTGGILMSQFILPSILQYLFK